MAQFGEDPNWYTGVVKAILHGKGFGFAQCDEPLYKQHYGIDAYLHSSQIEGLSVGTPISFRVKLNARGQPQALDVQPAAGDAAADALAVDDLFGGAAAMLEPSAQASPSGYNVGSAWFDTVMAGGASVGVPVVLNGIVEASGDPDGVKAAVKQWLMGQVGFPGRAGGGAGAPGGPRKVPPIAASPRWSPYPVAPVAVMPPVAASVSGIAEDPGFEERFEGEVSAIKQPTSEGRPAFGFVTCEETRARFGEDVFLHSSQAEVLQVGQRVRFGVQLKKGKPQAVDLEVIG